MPAEVARVVQVLVAEYEATETLESRVAHDADKIETLIQAVEYQALGHATAAWRESSLAALRTDSGRRLAQAIGSTDPQGWGSPFAASYSELRASRLERARRQHDEGTAPRPPDAGTRSAPGTSTAERRCPGPPRRGSGAHPRLVRPRSAAT